MAPEQCRGEPLDRRPSHGLLKLLGGEPGELVRRDSRFEELGIDDARCASAEGVVDVLVDHPELLQRPVVVAGDRAVIARPPEKLLELLEGSA